MIEIILPPSHFPTSSFLHLIVSLSIPFMLLIFQAYFVMFFQTKISFFSPSYESPTYIQLEVRKARYFKSSSYIQWVIIIVRCYFEAYLHQNIACLQWFVDFFNVILCIVRYAVYCMRE